MPRSHSAPERRQQILRGLMHVMAKRGYRGAPVAAIAREAGLAPGLVHYYFRSKRDLLLELFQAIHATALARFEKRLQAAGGDPRKRLFALTDALLEADGSSEADDAAACWVSIAAEAVHEPEVRAAYRSLLAELVERLSALLQDVLRAEGRSTRGAAALATAVAATVQGVHQVDAVAPELARHPGSSAPALRHMIEGLVQSQPRARAVRGRRRR